MGGDALARAAAAAGLVPLEDVEIPEAMQRPMARQAEAERERRARIISSEGEFQAADKLAGAASILSADPAALQLRCLQTLLEIGADQNSTIVFPLRIDLLRALLERPEAAANGNGLRGRDGSLST